MATPTLLRTEMLQLRFPQFGNRCSLFLELPCREFTAAGAR